MTPRHLVPCTALLLAAAPLATTAQRDSVAVDWSMELGLSSLQLREAALNPLRHRGTFGSIGLLRERSSSSVSGRLALEATFNPVATRYETGKNSFAAGLRLGYRRLYRIRDLAPDLALHLGGTGETYIHFAYFGDWDDSHGYWLTAYSLAPSVALRFGRWTGRVISLEASMPVVAMVSRPETPILYKVDNNTFGAVAAKLHENLSLTSLGEHMAVDATLSYTRPSSHLARSVYWRIFWLHNDMDHSAAIVSLRHTLGTSVAF